MAGNNSNQRGKINISIEMIKLGNLDNYSLKIYYIFVSLLYLPWVW